jgi:hypothetical protein
MSTMRSASILLALAGMLPASYFAVRLFRFRLGISSDEPDTNQNLWRNKRD